MSEKIKWLRDGRIWGVPTAVYPTFEKGVLRPFDWTLLKLADSPSVVAHFSSDGALPGVKYPSVELSESGQVWDSRKVWFAFNRTSKSWSLHEKKNLAF